LSNLPNLPNLSNLSNLSNLPNLVRQDELSTTQRQHVSSIPQPTNQSTLPYHWRRQERQGSRNRTAWTIGQRKHVRQVLRRVATGVAQRIDVRAHLSAESAVLSGHIGIDREPMRERERPRLQVISDIRDRCSASVFTQRRHSVIALHW
jgi:hypothetical protein